VPDFVGAVDQGTTSTRFMLFDQAGNEQGKRPLEHSQILPPASWVRAQPRGDLERTVAVIRTVVNEKSL
jgi:glycerol kinase